MAEKLLSEQEETRTLQAGSGGALVSSCPPSQFNKGGSIYIPLIFGLDTLVKGFYVKEFTLAETEWQYLAEHKEYAKTSVFRTSGSLIEFRGKYYLLQSSGKAPYTYVLISDDLTVKVALRPSRGKFPEIYIEFRSQCLWGGFRDAYTLVREWIDRWAVISNEVLSRADLTVDIHGTPFFNFTNIVSRSRSREEICKVFSTGNDITGYRYGSSPVSLRIYDKTEEIKKSGKTWFYDLWLKAGWDGVIPVWRVEFQLRRDFFKEFKIHSFDDLQNGLADIWRYLTEEWFSLREKVSEDTNKTRWPLLPFWQTVQSMTQKFGPITGIDREKIRRAKLEDIIPQIVGLHTTAGALLGKDTKEEVMHRILYLTDKYLKSQGKDFDAELKFKRKKHSFFERPFRDAEE